MYYTMDEKIKKIEMEIYHIKNELKKNKKELDEIKQILSRIVLRDTST